MKKKHIDFEMKITSWKSEEDQCWCIKNPIKRFNFFRIYIMRNNHPICQMISKLTTVPPLTAKCLSIWEAILMAIKKNLQRIIIINDWVDSQCHEWNTSVLKDIVEWMVINLRYNKNENIHGQVRDSTNERQN